MQDLQAERSFYRELFARNPLNEHIAGGYDELYRIAMSDLPAGPVLDLGCGTGAHTVRLARMGLDVIAVDITLEGVVAARRRLQAEGLTGRFLVANAEQLPFRDGAVDYGWTSLLVHHFPNPDRLLAEVSRVVRETVTVFEPNALNALTWLANNVVNRFWGIATMTPNQRAVWPHRLRRAFGSYGLDQKALHYVDRRWGDSLGFVRGLYAAITVWLPTRFRANKFLAVYQKRRR